MVAGTHALLQRGDQRIGIRRTDAFATQSGDHLARVPCQFGPLQKHDDVGIAKRRRQEPAPARTVALEATS